VLTLADTHERQEQVWKEAVEQWRDPAVQTLRKMVTDDKMAISHPMFEYVGEEAYTAAGGTLTADLFSDKDSTFADAALVKSCWLENSPCSPPALSRSRAGAGLSSV
jgi:ParB family chromosome partitioning protein